MNRDAFSRVSIQLININLDEIRNHFLIHAGDISVKGTPSETTDFLKWFELQDYEYKIFIAGNHDFYFERESAETIANEIPENVIYLNDSSTTINGIKIWGSPITPWFFLIGHSIVTDEPL